MRNGKELSDLELFIGEDGLLSIYHNDQECEITGCKSNIFGDGLVGRPK